MATPPNFRNVQEQNCFKCKHLKWSTTIHYNKCSKHGWELICNPQTSICDSYEKEDKEDG